MKKISTLILLIFIASCSQAIAQDSDSNDVTLKQEEVIYLKSAELEWKRSSGSKETREFGLAYSRLYNEKVIGGDCGRIYTDGESNNIFTGKIKIIGEIKHEDATKESVTFDLPVKIDLYSWGLTCIFSRHAKDNDFITIKNLEGLHGGRLFDILGEYTGLKRALSLFMNFGRAMDLSNASGVLIDDSFYADFLGIGGDISWGVLTIKAADSLDPLWQTKLAIPALSPEY